jgi:hypothetical protein
VNKFFIGHFDGRTPCQEIAKQLNEPKDPECWKIKWRLYLWTDSENKSSGTCTLEGYKFRDKNVLKGAWKLIRGTDADPNAPVYQLNFQDRPPIYLLKADDNVLLFLDSGKKLMRGNENVSYALYRIDK